VLALLTGRNRVRALRPIVVASQGHKSRSNASYVASFVRWIESLGLRPNRVHGLPSGSFFESTAGFVAGARTAGRRRC